MSFHICKDAAGLWRWYLLSESHRKIAISAEGYPERVDCLAAIRIVIQIDSSTPVFED